jgi:lysophospholipase L1-like esterase
MPSDKDTERRTFRAAAKHLIPRLRVLILCGVLAMAGFGFYYFWLCLPIGSGPAGPAVPHEWFQRPWTTNPVLLVGLGDSVTDGFGARKNYSYFARLADNPADEFSDMRGICLKAVLPGLQVTNLSVSGTTSFEHLVKQLPRLRPAGSNTTGIVVITSGGNDLIHNYGRTPPTEQAMYGATREQAGPWIDGFGRRLDAMLTNLEAAFPGGYQVFIADIFDPTDGKGDAERAHLPAWKDGAEILRAYNRVIYQFAEQHAQVHLVRIHDAFLGHGIHCTQFWSGHYHWDDPHYWYYDNLEDPNERGYDVIRRLFLIEIGKTMGGGK